MASRMYYARYEDYYSDENKRIVHEYPYSEDGEKCVFMNYTFTKEGEVFSPTGTQLKKSSCNNVKGKVVTLILYDKNGKKRIVHINVARAIYSMFSGENISREYIVIPKNNDFSDCRYENLKLISLSDYMLEKGINKTNKGRKKKYSPETVKAITYHYYHISRDIEEICETYGCSKTALHQIIKGRYI